jgi:hypothetical protein
MKPTGRYNPVRPDEIVRMRELRAQGLSLRKIGAIVGRESGTVYQHTSDIDTKEEVSRGDGFEYNESNWINLFI